LNIIPVGHSKKELCCYQNRNTQFCYANRCNVHTMQVLSAGFRPLVLLLVPLHLMICRSRASLVASRLWHSRHGNTDGLGVMEALPGRTPCPLHLRMTSPLVTHRQTTLSLSPCLVTAGKHS